MRNRFEHAIEKIDAYNANDPQDKERLYSERMSAWLMKLEPQASEPLRLAARAQHIGRWTIPRGDYAMDRRGYKQWREALAAFHAETTAKILRETGYGEQEIARVRSLLEKRNLKTDSECQTLEDAACLVFLEHELADFAAKHQEDKLIRILQRTWLKMSARGHEAARGLQLPSELGRLVEKALAG